MLLFHIITSYVILIGNETISILPIKDTQYYNHILNELSLKKYHFFVVHLCLFANLVSKMYPGVGKVFTIFHIFLNAIKKFALKC